MASENLMILVFEITIGIIGFASNLFVIIVVLGFTSMYKQLANVFVINQSFIDMTSSVLQIAQASSSFVSLASLPENIIFRELFCRLWRTRVFMRGLFTASTYNLIVLTIERYLKIVHPIAHKTSFTMHKAKILSIFAWLGGIVFCMLVDIPTSTVAGDECLVTKIWPNEFVSRVAGYFNLLVSYWLPIAAFIFCYTKMIRSLRRVNTQGIEKLNNIFYDFCFK